MRGAGDDVAGLFVGLVASLLLNLVVATRHVVLGLILRPAHHHFLGVAD